MAGDRPASPLVSLARSRCPAAWQRAVRRVYRLVEPVSTVTVGVLDSVRAWALGAHPLWTGWVRLPGASGHNGCVPTGA